MTPVQRMLVKKAISYLETQQSNHLFISNRAEQSEKLKLHESAKEIEEVIAGLKKNFDLKVEVGPTPLERAMEHFNPTPFTYEKGRFVSGKQKGE